MTIILGLRSKHDAAAALVIDGQLVAAATEERFTKKKHHFGFPSESIKAILKEAGVQPQQVDIVARDGISIKKTLFRLARQPLTTWTPRLYKEVFSKAVNRHIRHSQDIFSDETAQLTKLGITTQSFFVEHHMGHAAYAWYSLGAPDATVLVLDGRGHYIGGGSYLAQDGKLKLISEITSQDGSVGLFYSAVTDALGFSVGDGEGKTMGLACYGDPTLALAEIEPYAPTVMGNRTVRSREWNLETDVIRNRLFAHYQESASIRLLIHKYGDANVAAAAQYILEKRMRELVRNIIATTGQRNLVAGGGVFLNVKASKDLLDQHIVDTIFVPPGPGDDGLPAGYALAASAALDKAHPVQAMQSAYLGPSFSNEQVLTALTGVDNISFRKMENISAEVAQLIADGKVIGWFQGKMEWGPRALGNRSVLADPRDPKMRDRINERLKKRDWFMPFAPSVLQEYCDEVFVNYQSCAYMNLAFDVKPAYVEQIPAVIHVDQTARPQEVHRSTNPRYYDLIEAFRKLTGIPLVLNTSFNRHGLPIVCTPKDAIDHLRWGCVDILVIEDYLIERTGAIVEFPGLDKVSG